MLLNHKLRFGIVDLVLPPKLEFGRQVLGEAGENFRQVSGEAGEIACFFPTLNSNKSLNL
jgi:hypothetical protein